MVRTLAQGVEFIPGYRLVRCLGRGGFGEVWEAEAPGNIRKAIKIAPMQAGQKGLRGREFEGLQKIRKVRHPYLLSIERFEVIDGDLVVIMELAEKSLADRFEECIRQGLPGIPRDELLGYLSEAAEALDYLNRNHGLQHLDVKPENIFLCGGHAKIGDFGLVQSQDTVLVQAAIAISPPYAPPELFDGRIESSIDQYSLAVTYQEMLTGTRPYDAPDLRRLIHQHLRGKPDLSKLPVGDRGVLLRALQRNPAQRFESCSDLFDALREALVFGRPTLQTDSSQTMTNDSAGQPGHANIFPQFVPTQQQNSQNSREQSETIAVNRSSAATDALQSLGADEYSQEDDCFRSTFVAYLPKSVYAHKLRGFIDTMQAEIINCNDEVVVIRLRERGWKFFRQKKSIFVEIQSFCKNLNNDSRVVDVKVWGTGPRLERRAMGRRAMLLISCLKSFFIADNRCGISGMKETEIRAAVVN